MSFKIKCVFYAIIVGTVVGAIMSIVTEYYTAMGKAPVYLLFNNLLLDMLPTLLVVYL
jgi:K(+)-stimulated pyrophosphate-energized sodium pump